MTDETNQHLFAHFDLQFGDHDIAKPKKFKKVIKEIDDVVIEHGCGDDPEIVAVAPYQITIKAKCQSPLSLVEAGFLFGAIAERLEKEKLMPMSNWMSVYNSDGTVFESPVD